jgi:hypothetical protein
MAVNESRSLNNELNEGATDGKYRKVRPNTTVAPGMGDQLVNANRSDLNPYWNYDFIDQEDPTKINPLKTEAQANKPKNLGPLAFLNNDQMGANY